MGPTLRTLLFTDLDGTLLDEGTTDREVGARLSFSEGIDRVVLATSRTLGEAGRLAGRWGWTGDVIAENGAIVGVRDADLAHRIAGSTGITLRPSGWWEVILGIDRREVEDRFEVTLRQAGIESDLAVQAGDRRASLLLPAAKIIQDRRGPALLAACAAQGLNAVRGGTWITVWAGPDKGEAARRYAAALAESTPGTWRTAAIGNAANDAPLLRVVDRGFVIADPHLGPDPALFDLPGCELLSTPGSSGWIDAIRRLRPTPS